MLTDVNLDELISIFNLSFSDYFLPLCITKDQFIHKIETENIQLSLSVGAFKNNKLIGFILHGINDIENKNVLYNGGTGVIPEERGRHLTQKMYSHTIPFLQKEKIDRIILEVLKQNQQALKSYLAIGFTPKRELLCFKGEIVPDLNLNSQIIIKKLADLAWPELRSYWDVEPSWQNSPAVADKLFSTNISLGAYLKNQLAGYIIYNPTNQRILQIAVKKEFRNQCIATSLVNEIIRTQGSNMSVTNIDAGSIESCRFFTKLGLQNYVNQIEMVYNFQ